MVEADLDALPRLIADAAEPLPNIDDPAFRAMFDRFGDARVVLLGEASHGTSEFYRARAEISKRLQAYVKEESNNVTVSVTAINSYRFVVNGNVERTGAYTSNRFVTVSEAIAMAGGPNRFADPQQTVIIRPDSLRADLKKRIPIDYPAILKGTHPEQDLPLVSGDIVYVP